jgi:hypothetical protein
MHTYRTGTLAGAGSFRCEECGFHVALRTLDEIPECPRCGEAKFARTSMFDVAGTDSSDLHSEDAEDWVEAVREGITDAGHFLAYQDGERISVLPLSREWTRIGRSLTAHIRLDDPTVSRRHALVCRQSGQVKVLDDRSLNGVFLNGERVEWHDLEDGDELIVGRYSLYFLDTSQISARPDATPAPTAA